MHSIGLVDLVANGLYILMEEGIREVDRESLHRYEKKATDNYKKNTGEDLSVFSYGGYAAELSCSYGDLFYVTGGMYHERYGLKPIVKKYELEQQFIYTQNLEVYNAFNEDKAKKLLIRLAKKKAEPKNPDHTEQLEISALVGNLFYNTMLDSKRFFDYITYQLLYSYSYLVAREMQSKYGKDFIPAINQNFQESMAKYYSDIFKLQISPDGNNRISIDTEVSLKKLTNLFRYGVKLEILRIYDRAYGNLRQSYLHPENL